MYHIKNGVSCNSLLQSFIFCTGLIHLPQLYANFVEDQYLSIFAIALPYTNPSK